jgi:hypothetical protein
MKRLVGNVLTLLALSACSSDGPTSPVKTLEGLV